MVDFCSAWAAGLITEYITSRQRGGPISMANFVTCWLFALSLPPTVPFSVVIVGVVVALSLAGYLAGCRIQDPSYPLKGKGALVLLILLNSRNNLRHYRFAGVLAKLLPTGGSAS